MHATFDEVRKELEEMGWPSGNALKAPDIKKRIEEATSFLDPSKIKKPSQRLFCLYANIQHTPKCIECGKDCVYSAEKMYPENIYAGWTLCCSRKCAYASKVFKDKAKRTNLERYGVENPFQSEEIKERIKQNNIDRYGVDHHLKISEFREKTKNTNLERYGVENPMQRKEIKDKAKRTNMKKYGVNHYSKTTEFNEKIKVTSLMKYGVYNYSQKHIPQETLEILENSEWMEEKYKELGGVRLGKLLSVDPYTVYDRLKKHNIPIDPNVGTSFGERQVASFIESLGFEIITSDRSVLDGKELDIYIPSKHLAIEYNGLFWHSERFKEKSYHLEKTNLCNDKGVRLLHLFEDEWLTRQDQVKAKIKSILGVDDRERVFARKCEIVVLTNHDVKSFYEENHIQGHVNATNILALKHNDTIVASMSFKHTRGYMELVRYATSKHVVGGFSKLLRAFWDMNDDVDRIVSFADIRWSDGGMYANNGWTLTGRTNPNYYYVCGEQRFLKQNFRKKKIEKIFPEVYSDSKTEREMMMELGLDRIYDCGLLKYEMVRPT